MFTNREHFSKIRALFRQNQVTFFYFQKRAGERPSPLPPAPYKNTHSPLVARLFLIVKDFDNNDKKSGRMVKSTDQLI